jgi:hypothetical protein
MLSYFRLACMKGQFRRSCVLELEMRFTNTETTVHLIRNMNVFTRQELLQPFHPKKLLLVMHSPRWQQFFSIGNNLLTRHNVRFESFRKWINRRQVTAETIHSTDRQSYSRYEMLNILEGGGRITEANSVLKYWRHFKINVKRYYLYYCLLEYETTYTLVGRYRRFSMAVLHSKKNR